MSAGIPTSAGNLTVNTYQGPDQVHLYSTAAGSTFVNTGAGMGPGGNNQIIVGDANSFTGLNDIEGPLSIDAGNGSGNSLTFTEAGSPFGDTLTLTNDALIRYNSSMLPKSADIAAQRGATPLISPIRRPAARFGGGIELDTTQGANTVYVPSTLEGTSLNIRTGLDNAVTTQPPGPDRVFVGYNAGNPTAPIPMSTGTLDQILSPVTVIGQAIAGTPGTSVVIDDQGAVQSETYTVQSLSQPAEGSVKRFEAAAVYYQGTGVAMTLNAGAEGNRFNVQGVLAGTTATINTGAGDNILMVGSTSGNLNAIQGTLTLAGGGGTNHLTLIDENAGAAAAYQLSASQFTRGAPRAGARDHR